MTRTPDRALSTQPEARRWRKDKLAARRKFCYVIAEKRQSYSIASFFASKEHDLHTERGLTDAQGIN